MASIWAVSERQATAAGALAQVRTGAGAVVREFSDHRPRRGHPAEQWERLGRVDEDQIHGKASCWRRRSFRPRVLEGDGLRAQLRAGDVRRDLVPLQEAVGLIAAETQRLGEVAMADPLFAVEVDQIGFFRLPVQIRNRARARSSCSRSGGISKLMVISQFLLLLTIERRCVGALGILTLS